MSTVFLDLKTCTADHKYVPVTVTCREKNIVTKTIAGNFRNIAGIQIQLEFKPFIGKRLVYWLMKRKMSFTRISLKLVRIPYICCKDLLSRSNMPNLNPLRTR